MRISYDVSHPSCFPSLPCQVTHPCSFPNKGETIPVHLYSPCTQGSIVNNCPVASPLKNTESFPPTPSLPETINCEEVHCCIFITILKDFLQWFLSKLFLFRVWGETVMVEGLPQKPSMALILYYQTAVLDTTAKETSLPLTASSGTVHGPPHGFHWQHGPQPSRIWTPTCSVVASQTTDITAQACCPLRPC